MRSSRPRGVPALGRHPGNVATSRTLPTSPAGCTGSPPASCPGGAGTGSSGSRLIETHSLQHKLQGRQPAGRLHSSRRASFPQDRHDQRSLLKALAGSTTWAHGFAWVRSAARPRRRHLLTGQPARNGTPAWPPMETVRQLRALSARSLHDMLKPADSSCIATSDAQA